MPIAFATRRASCRSSIEQQLPNEVSPPAWSYSCIDRPMTSCPCSARSAAATDESTPPDMATTIFMGFNESPSHAGRSTRGTGAGPGETAQLFNQTGKRLDDTVDLRLVRNQPQTETERV